MQPKVYTALYISHHTIMEMTHAFSVGFMQIRQEGNGAQIEMFLTERTCAPHTDVVMVA